MGKVVLSSFGLPPATTSVVVRIGGFGDEREGLVGVGWAGRRGRG